MKLSCGLVVAGVLAGAGACTDQYGTGAVPVLADAGDAAQGEGGSPTDDGGTAGGGCGQARGVAAPKICNGDFGSGASAACPAGRAICKASGECISRCDENVCTQGSGHDGPLCDAVGFFQEEQGSRQDARCGTACDASAACPPGRFCTSGIGHTGGVCLKPLASGTVFGISPSSSASCDDGGTCTAVHVYLTCAEAGAVACLGRKAFGLNEDHDFQGWCVCGSPPGASCAADSECSDGHCNADKKCGGGAGEPCTPLGPYEIALLPETSCRTTCSRTTCKCEPPCKVDADCGGPYGGKVCNGASTCVGGCRGADGTGCEHPMHCTSQSSAIGICTDGL